MRIMMAYFENLVNIAGGLERTLCRLSNYFYNEGHEVVIVSYDQNIGSPFYSLNDGIEVINLKENIQNFHLSFVQKMRREWARLKGKESFRNWQEARRPELIKNFNIIYNRFKPDVILAFNHQTMGELSRTLARVPICSLFRNDPAQLCPQMTKQEFNSIENAAGIQVLLPVFVETLKKYIKNNRVYCIPNAIEIPNVQVQLGQEKDNYKIIQVGRINKRQKRQDLLVEAFERLAPDYPNWTVEFWGDGEIDYQKKMVETIRKKHLERRILFMGKTTDIESKYLSADIFCFPSRYEGFPNALGEAMAIGLPSIVCRDCASCMSIIQDGLTGLIAEPSAKSLAGALKILMDNKEKRCSIGEKARLSISAYQPQSVYKMWNDLLMQLCQKSE